MDDADLEESHPKFPCHKWNASVQARFLLSSVPRVGKTNIADTSRKPSRFRHSLTAYGCTTNHMLQRGDTHAHLS